MRKLACLAAFSFALVVVGACASVAFFTVTVVNPNELSLNITVKAENNGITVTGASDIVLQQQQDQAASASVLVSDLFRWLTTELAKTAPPPHPVTPPSANDASASPEASSSDGASSDGASSDGDAPVDGGSAD